MACLFYFIFSLIYKGGCEVHFPRNDHEAAEAKSLMLSTDNLKPAALGLSDVK